MNITFKSVNGDLYGNPRYVCHFFALLKDDERKVSNYDLACKRANKIGGRKYRGSDFGGGIVFQSHNLLKLEQKIREVVNNLK